MLKRKQADIMRLNNFRDALIDAQESKRLLRKELDDLDLEKINELNFFKVGTFDPVYQNGDVVRS